MPHRVAPRTRRRRGMTLIEILVVVGIFSLMAGMVVLGFGSTRSARLGAAVTEVANTIRFAFDKARVTGRHFRLWIDLDKGTFSLQQAEEAMYLPPTDREGRTLVRSEAELEDQARRDEQARDQYFRSVQALGYDMGAAGDDPYAVQVRDVPRRRPPLFQSFSPENELSSLGKPIELPEGAKITYVRTAEDPEPITSGEAAIYFFPQGRTQMAHIQVEAPEGGDAGVYTIIVQPLTGRVQIRPERVDLELPGDPSDVEDDLGKKIDRRSF